MAIKYWCLKSAKKLIATAALIMIATTAQAEIDGHGPDAWRVNGVSSNDFLNARMGPGTDYPVIEKFAHNERKMQQITCVPFYTAAHYTAMSEAQLKALPPRWCLIRNQSMSKAGWVLQRFITPDDAQASIPNNEAKAAPAKAKAQAVSSDVNIIAEAEELVREVYERYDLAQLGSGIDPLDPSVAGNYFSSDIVAFLASDKVQAHPLYGAQDFDGSIDEPKADPDRPMYRGMITINVDFTNFGQQQRAVYYLRKDTTKAGAPLRIFSVEHNGWSYP